MSCPPVDEARGPDVARDNVVYYVRSSQPTRASRYSAAGGSSYEVRLKAWNCSCPAFTFSAVNATESYGREGDMDEDGPEEGPIDAESGSNYGGLTLEKGAVPLCKHLLACFLSEKYKPLSSCVEERVVGRDEAAGWAAGWGD